jgi:hypothetical protein
MICVSKYKYTTYSQRIWSPLSVMAVAPHKLREKICLANGDAAITSRVLSVNLEQKLKWKNSKDKRYK